MTDDTNYFAENDKLWDYDKPGESKWRFRVLLPDARECSFQLQTLDIRTS